MSKITIDLTEEQEHFLKEFASKHYEGSKDNVGTNQPIHLVQTRRERVVDPEYDEADVIKYFVPDWQESYDSSIELIKAYYENKGVECPIKIVGFDDAYAAKEFVDVNGEEQVIFEDKDYFDAYGIDEDFYDKIYIEYYWETKAYFFILDEAKEYIKYQGHNLTNPRTFTVGGGYANKGEYHYFWELLFAMGNQLNNSEKEMDCSVKQNDIKVSSIAIKYDNGTEKTIDKGMVLNMKEQDGEVTLNMEFAKCSGTDLTTIAYGFIEMSSRMGLFKDIEEVE